MLKGNKGEWSETYVFLKLLADGKVYAAGSDMQKQEDNFLPILKIIRKELESHAGEYIPNHECDKVQIFLNGTLHDEYSQKDFQKQADTLLEKLKNPKVKSAFALPETERFLKKIGCSRVSAPSKEKADILVKILDINTGFSPVVGFNIKSDLGSPPTLLNASKSTKFTYKMPDKDGDLLKKSDEMCQTVTKCKSAPVKDIVSMIMSNNGTLSYYETASKVFKDNLILIDSNMDKIIAQTLVYYYRDGISRCSDMVKALEQDNILAFGNINAYSYKFKKFLTAVALGMKPATYWDGIDEATGGYIIVKKSGETLAYHIYNRNYFEDYLLYNTKYDTPSTKRHKFGYIYKNNNKDKESFIQLNLQIRFI